MKENEPIRIAHIVGKWVGGGVEAFLMNYYRNIDKSKIQFDFIIDKDSLILPPEKEIKQMGGRIFYIPPYQKIFIYQKELKRILKSGNYQIVHSHINTMSIFPLRIAKKVGVPIRIAHSHSTTNKKEWKKNVVKTILKRFSKVYATHYFCCSELAGRWMFGNKAFDQEKVTIINNAININKFINDENIREKVRKELHIENDTLVIGHIGRFTKQKNHKFLIDIFNEIQKQEKKSILLLVGLGTLQKEIKEKVKSLGIENKVQFLNQREDVNEIYQGIDIFLLPSLYEGLGIVLIEAQVSGICCFASTEVPTNAKITNNVTFIELNQSSKTWANNILEKYNNHKRENNKDLVAKSGYDIVLEAEKLQKKYLSLINRSTN